MNKVSILRYLKRIINDGIVTTIFRNNAMLTICTCLNIDLEKHTAISCEERMDGSYCYASWGKRLRTLS